jgi:hypothetical protein
MSSKKVKLHNDELTDIYSSSNIIQVIRFRRMRLVDHVACMGERRSEVHAGFWLRNLM